MSCVRKVGSNTAAPHQQSLPLLTTVLVVAVTFASIGVALISEPLQAEEIPAPTGSELLVPKNSRLTLRYVHPVSNSAGMTEGPTAGPDAAIYFSYISSTELPGQILRFDPKTGKTTVAVADSRKSNGLKFNAAGLLVACEGANYGGRCISAHDLKTGKRTVLSSQIAGATFNSPNDLVIDRQGRIYFTDPRYGGPEPQTIPKMSVYRVLADGTAEIVAENVEKPNGIALSPDEKTLYIADTNNGSNGQPSSLPGKPGAMKVYAFPLNENGFPVGDRRTVYDFGTDSGCDGLTVDDQGRLYITCRNARRAGVLVLHPKTDREIAFIPTAPPDRPADSATGLPSNVCWGRGTDAGTLYITIDVSLHSIALRPETPLLATP